MGAKAESRLQLKIQKEIKKTYKRRVFIFKVHGGPFQEQGLPDLLGCLDGRLFGIEVKHPDEDHPVSESQHAQLRRIARAGGEAAIVESVEEALRVLESM